MFKLEKNQRLNFVYRNIFKLLFRFTNFYKDSNFINNCKEKIELYAIEVITL